MQKLVCLAIACACLLLAPTFAFAQLDELKDTTPEQRASALTEMMTRTLSLDEKTSASVSGINLEYAEKTQALMESAGPQLQKLMTFRKNSEAKDAELKAVFTPLQYSEYLEKKSEIEAMGKQKLLQKFESAHPTP
jgi:hypothetical protein